MENKREVSIPVGSQETGLRVDLAKTAAALIVGNAVFHGVIESGVTSINTHGPKLTYGHHYIEKLPEDERLGVYTQDFNAVPFIKDVKAKQIYAHAYDPGKDEGLVGRLPAWSSIFEQVESNFLYRGYFTQEQFADGFYLTQMKSSLEATPKNLFNKQFAVNITAIPPEPTMDYIADGMLMYGSPSSDISQQNIVDNVNQARRSVTEMLEAEHIPGLTVSTEIAQVETGRPLNFGEYKELMGLVTKNEYRSFPAMLQELRKGSGSHMSAALKTKLLKLETKYKEDEGGLRIEVVPVGSATETQTLSAGTGCVVPITKNPEAVIADPSNVTIPLLLPLLIATPFIRRRRLKAAQLEQNALIPSRKQRRLVEAGGGTIRDKLEVERYKQVVAAQKEKAEQAKARASKLPRLRYRAPKRFWVFNAFVIAASSGMIGYSLTHEKSENPAPAAAASNGKTNKTSVYLGAEREPCDDDMPIIYNRIDIGK